MPHCDNAVRCGPGSEVMGYMRPISFYNIGKKEEHRERKHFTENIAANHSFTEKYENSVT
jgi:hypothetical protein